MNDDRFTEEQRHYLQGFVAGADLARSASRLPTFGQTLARNGVLPSPTVTPGPSSPLGPESLQYEAQSRLLAEGKKLCPEEEAKRQTFPLDRWDELAACAANGQYPKGVDVLMTKYFGLFYVAPAQDSYMCRLRFPAGIVTSHQFRGVADIAGQYGGGYTHGTTRANLQIREIRAADSLHVLTSLQDLGIVPRARGRTTSGTSPRAPPRGSTPTS